MKKLFLGFALIAIYLVLPVTKAEDIVTETSVQMTCFDTLKDNLSEIPDFEQVSMELEEKEYSNIDKHFSDYYKNMSYFGIDLDEPRFETRLYSYGEETGFINPPFSPFPVSTGTDMWTEPARQNMILEEYIRTPEGDLQFLSCGLFQLNSYDLMNITPENYAYDGGLVSLLKTDEENKILFTENDIFDYDDYALGSWKRLIVYPKSTQNEFFNRYDAVEAFPHNNVDSWDVFWEPLTPSETDIATETGSTASGTESIDDLFETDNMFEEGENVMISIIDSRGMVVETNRPEAFLSPEISEDDENFYLYTYYNNIENAFPEFANYLSINGVVSFDTFKKAISQKDNEEVMSLFHDLIYPEEITSYVLRKERAYEASEEFNEFEEVEELNPEEIEYLESFEIIPELEEFLENIDTLDDRIKEALPLEINTPKVVNDVQTNFEDKTDQVAVSKIKNNKIIILGGVLVLLVLSLVVIRVKK